MVRDAGVVDVDHALADVHPNDAFGMLRELARDGACADIFSQLCRPRDKVR